MTGPASPPLLMRFSTDAFAERERLTAWRDTVGTLSRIDVEPLADVPFYAHVNVLVMPDLGLISGRGAVGRSSRTRAHVADGVDTLIFQYMSVSGVARQIGRDIDVPAGDAITLSNADVGGFTFHGEQAAVGVVVPRAALGPFLYDPDAALVNPVPKENEALQLLKSYVGAIEREPPTGEDLQRLAAAHVQDLVALALGATRDAAEIARTRGVRAARLHAARTYVMRNLGRPELSAVHVAAHLGVTPRYLHMLFETEGVSLSEFLLIERLARAHRMLAALRHARETISAIASAAGFGDLSHFNRSFRRRYGCTPSDVRAAAPRERKDETP